MTTDPNGLLQYAREDGTTSEQMKAAAPGATFVIHHIRALGYFKSLARFLERDDLVFMTLAQFDNPARTRGRRFGQIVVDHYAATVATPVQRQTIDHLQASK